MNIIERGLIRWTKTEEVTHYIQKRKTHILDPLKTYHGKDGVKRLVDYIEDKVKQLYAMISQQPWITNLLKGKHQPKEKSGISLLENLIPLRMGR